MGGANGDLHPLRRLVTDKEIVLAPDVVHNGLVDLFAGDTDRAAIDNAGKADDSNFGQARTDVHDHAPGRLRDGQARPDSRGHGFFDKIHFALPRGFSGLFRCPLLYGRDVTRNGDNDLRFCGETAVTDLRQKMPQH